MAENYSLGVAHHLFSSINLILRALIELFSADNSVIKIELAGP